MCDKLRALLSAHHTTLPTLYVTVKTHKFTDDHVLSNMILNLLKVRPIVSCCNSPTENLAWITQQVINQLLAFIPSHLSDIYSHLEHLRSMDPESLAGSSFYTADVVSFYTNINVDKAIQNVIDLLIEYQEQTIMYGFSPVQIHEMLEVVFQNSYFTYNQNVYQQMVGLFMGCKPSPTIAVIRVYTFERASIYMDVNFITVNYYKIYIDDASSTSKSRDGANQRMKMIADQDEDHLLKLEVDYPARPVIYTPYLRSEIRISGTGVVESRLFQKEYSKNITLHYKSHHGTETKIASLKSNYKDADYFSSGTEQKQHSYDILDKLYINNGYINPRKFLGSKKKKKGHKKIKNAMFQDKSILKLPFLSDSVSNKIRQFVKRQKLPLTVIFTPGTKLKSMFCHSRPRDKQECSDENCKTCEALVSGNCKTKGVVYQITCLICLLIYIGETLRYIDGRFLEHLRNATKPNCKSYSKEALAVHYREHHPGIAPKLQLKILAKESNTLRRKIIEGMHIMNKSPQINLKIELDNLKKYLLNNV